MTLHPLAKLLYGLQSTALTLPMQPGGCTALQLLTFSQASICSHPKVTAIELPPHSHPHYPRAVKAPTVFPQNPPFLHANLIHCSPQAHPANPFGQQVGNFIPIFFLFPPLCTSLPLPPASLPTPSRSSYTQTPSTHFVLKGRKILPPLPNRRGAPQLAARAGMGWFQVLTSPHQLYRSVNWLDWEGSWAEPGRVIGC